MEANLTELHNAVSGALDRLHYEHDPCVKYDPKRKIWIYLHRGRKLEEFGMSAIYYSLKIQKQKKNQQQNMATYGCIVHGLNIGCPLTLSS